ncbi:hypothetical protein CAPTEDRAFT_222978 [Capitella teleta]|uniref:Snake toxin/toxin-like domain-containing protein n=1 Tax=Capitella teleta TaxID=283909 RepID=X2ATT7_CAPTE|nr:hypothetical protein CAPTEDRAFT_222978 [Capitella teleta]|eukprot:ELU04720.1 hypothetical protein CAPTEDRAFT_222978 [Capitella teleta]
MLTSSYAVDIRYALFLQVFVFAGCSADLIYGVVQPERDPFEVPPVGNLSCHRCYLSVHGKSCLSLTDITEVEVQHCNIYEQYCQVERYTTNDRITTFARRCAEKCDPGCKSAGKNYKVEYCYSCCQDNFCNHDNSASASPLPGRVLFFFIAPFFLII